ncbi:MAG: malonate decarboxylase subunit alpha [Legionella sp.]|nr:MAG: malonate decarboxylase subunit alpha [Legionella sp.]PJD98370.1 MAG: malonate decarboxylase subunit alpha [Legionella sp.]
MDYQKKRKDYEARLKLLQPFFSEGKRVCATRIVCLLEALIKPHDLVCLEGNNQKQADFLARSLCQVDVNKVHALHMLQSAIALPEHLDLFELGIAEQLDFSFAGPQAARLALMIQKKQIKIGNIHTYNELYARYVMDLTPKVALITAEQADIHGNLYTGANTEETAAIIEATAFKNGLVIAQVNHITEQLPRVDIPGDWVNVVVQAPSPAYIEPLFTRDPALIDEIKILMAMMVIKGIYAPYQVNRLNHGVGFNTCAIELLLPTYAQSLGLKGKICKHWMVNPLPTLIPAIEAGFVESVFCVGGEVGMNEYVRSKPDVFFTGRDGSLRSNRLFGQLAGHYGCDAFVGATLQIDTQGNSSTATKGRVAGFGGAPNMGCDTPGRRHSSYAWLKAGQEKYSNTPNAMPRGRKLVVQMIETFQGPGKPTFVERLDAWELQREMKADLPPIMIYGDDLSHIVTEEGIANLLLCKTLKEREHAIRGVAGYTPVGLKRDRQLVEELRSKKIIQRPEDLNISLKEADRDLLAAQSIHDLVVCSQGLYCPPNRFRSW